MVDTSNWKWEPINDSDYSFVVGQTKINRFTVEVDYWHGYWNKQKNYTVAISLSRDRYLWNNFKFYSKEGVENLFLC